MRCYKCGIEVVPGIHKCPIGNPVRYGTTITCMYSCALCGLKKIPVQIPTRVSATDQDVVTWLRDVATPALVADHEARSPGCHPKELSEFYIPMAGADYVGGPAIQ